MRKFMNHPWRGNVRELQNTVSRAVLLSPSEEIQPEDIEWDKESSSECLVAEDIERLQYKEAKAAVLERFHLEYLGSLLTRNSSNVTRAAKECGMERQALQQIMRRYGIKSKDFAQDEPA